MDFTDDADDPTPDGGTATVTTGDLTELSVEDIEQFERRWLQANERQPGYQRRTGHDESGVAKAFDPVAKGTDLNGVTYKSEFPWLYDPVKGVRWDFDPVQLRTLSQENAWVQMLIQSITKEISEMSWTITTTDDSAETAKRINTHPDDREPIQKDLPDDTAEDIHDLLMRPNPDATYHDLIEMAMADLLEVGSAAVVKAFPSWAYGEDQSLQADPEDLEPRALKPSAPEVWTKEYLDKAGILDGFWQFEVRQHPGGRRPGSRGQQDPVFFDPEEVLWQDMSPRTNRRYGIPPTLLVQDWIKAVDLALVQEQEYLSRGSTPSGMVTFPDGIDRPAGEERGNVMTEDVKGKPWKLLEIEGTSAEYTPFSYNFQEMQFTERQQWYARVISSAFQVPTAVVGLEPEKINYATFQGERSNFESNTLGPYVQMLERWLNWQLVDMHWDGYRFEILPGMSESTRDKISDRVRSEFDAGLRTRNEARREIGLDEADEDGYKDDVTEGGSDEDMADLLANRLAKAEGLDKETYDDYPDAAVENARMALDAREEHGNPNDCGTRVGWERANQLDNRESLSRETIGRMAAFRRHEDNYDPDADPEDCGWLMWKAWGGEEGIAWAEDKLDEIEASAGGSGNVHKADDDPLRNTDEWAQFAVQPSDVESLTDAIADDVAALYDTVLESDDIMAEIERLAADDTEKSLGRLTQKLRDILTGSDIAGRIADALDEHTTEAAQQALQQAAAQTGDEADVDVAAIEAKLEDREVVFADRFAQEMADDIRDTVADGWASGMNSDEIGREIAEGKEINSGWDGAERIARQELQIATGEARQDFAAEIGKVEVWENSGDDRVRPAHQDDGMAGTWKYPSDDWIVDYSAEGRGVHHESVPGDSEPGIGCRCYAALVDRDDVDAEDYAGTGTP